MPILTDQERLGTTIGDGRCRLESVLGRGGMGTVFEAVHEWTGRRVAVKLLRHDVASDVDASQRVLQEARSATAIEHPNVVEVLDMGRHDEWTVYMVFELLRGESLADRLDVVGRLDPMEAVMILLPVADAVAAAHRLGIVHRDLKPEQHLPRGTTAWAQPPKLLDFGIRNASGAGGQVRTGVIAGTPEYLSPEHAQGFRAGPASDVWSLGIVLFECITGTRPFEGDTVLNVLLAIISNPIPSLRDTPDVPGPIADVVEGALVRDPAARIPDAEAFRDALAAASEVEFRAVAQSLGAAQIPLQVGRDLACRAPIAWRTGSRARAWDRWRRFGCPRPSPRASPPRRGGRSPRWPCPWKRPPPRRRRPRHFVRSRKPYPRSTTCRVSAWGRSGSSQSRSRLGAGARRWLRSSPSCSSAGSWCSATEPRGPKALAPRGPRPRSRTHRRRPRLRVLRPTSARSWRWTPRSLRRPCRQTARRPPRLRPTARRRQQARRALGQRRAAPARGRANRPRPPLPRRNLPRPARDGLRAARVRPSSAERTDRSSSTEPMQTTPTLSRSVRLTLARSSRLRMGMGVALLAVTLLLLVRPAVAHAQDTAEANALIDQGVERRRAGDDEGALELFTRAWEAGHAPRARAQMALVEQALGHFVDAEAHLLEALAVTEDEWIVLRRADLALALEAIQLRLGYLEVRGGIEGPDLPPRWTLGRDASARPAHSPRGDGSYRMGS
ncbi:MAG: serine/threonine protein kinase [Sandaracinaceae bacterium]|nr:serine/threonine protein kinase [Sandaracinaceae bacterium]